MILASRSIFMLQFLDVYSRFFSEINKNWKVKCVGFLEQWYFSVKVMGNFSVVTLSEPTKITLVEDTSYMMVAHHQAEAWYSVTSFVMFTNLILLFIAF